MKHCKTCDTTKELGDFYTDSRKESGVRSECKECNNASSMKRYGLSYDNKETLERAIEYLKLP